jgi:hypothetical protein
MKRLLSILMAFALMLAFTSVAGAAGNGTVDPYSLGLQALQAKDGITDLYVNVKPTLDGYSAPNSFKKVQLKSYDVNGKLAYTRNYNGDVAAPNGQADIKLDDVKRYQPLNTEVLVQNGQTKDTKVLRAETKVQFRPDLAVDKITSPAKVHKNESFAVSSIINELNGDVGAKATIQILNGTNALDTAEGVLVNAGAQQMANFMLKLSEVGTYTLTAKISNVTPGDYDDSNNEKTFTVEVIDDNKSVSYWSDYTYYKDYNYNYESSYDNSHQSGSYEYFSVGTWTPDKVDPASFKLTLTSETGNKVEAKLPDLYKYSNWGDYSQFYGYDQNTNTNIWGYSTPWGTQTYAGHYAGHYSYNWQSYWGSGAYSYDYGQLLKAEKSVDVNLDLLSANGTHYGGNYSIALTPYSASWDYWSDWWYWYNYHYWGNYTYYSGYNSGVTTW